MLLKVANKILEANSNSGPSTFSFTACVSERAFLENIVTKDCKIC